MQYTTYLFDFDGTLVDSMPYWSQKMIHILKKTNTAYPQDIIKIITPLGDVGTANYFKDVLKVPLAVEEMLELMDEYALPKYRDIIPMKDGVADSLTMLKKKGYSLNVLTASPHKMLDPCLKRNGIYDLFDNIWSCDDFNLTKADSRIYREVVRKIGVTEAETLFFDDNITAIRTAASAGFGTVGVFDESGREFTDVLKETADFYIESFCNLELIDASMIRK